MDGKDAPADGVVTGYGKVDGRLVAVCAYDFTVMAGSMGMTGELKVTRLRELALHQADPVHLAARLGRRADPGGGRVAVRRLRPPLPRGGRDERRDPADRRADGAVRRRHRLHPRASPTSCRWSRAAARWRSPARTSSRPSPARTSPRRSSAARRSTPQVSGVGDLEVKSDEECIQAIKDYLSYFPQNCEQTPPIRERRRPGRPHGRGAARRAAGVATASPTTCTR